MCLYFRNYNIDIYGHQLLFICVGGKNMTITITQMCLSTPTRVFFLESASVFRYAYIFIM